MSFGAGWNPSNNYGYSNSPWGGYGAQGARNRRPADEQQYEYGTNRTSWDSQFEQAQGTQGSNNEWSWQHGNQQHAYGGPQAQQQTGPTIRQETAVTMRAYENTDNGSIELSGLSSTLQPILKQADANGDGIVTGQELAQSLKAADTNGDGSLSAAEIQAYETAPTSSTASSSTADSSSSTASTASNGSGPSAAQIASSLIRELDRNHDGQIDTSAIPTQLQSMFASADVNSDGKLSSTELANAIAKLDTDGNGQISRSEWKSGIVVPSSNPNSSGS